MFENTYSYQINEDESSTVNEPYIPIDDFINENEAERLINIEKVRINDERIIYPDAGKFIEIQIKAKDESEFFKLTVHPRRIDFYKTSDQIRMKSTNLPLVRIDIGKVTHKNPDGKLIVGPHIHIYKEGYGDRYAEPLDPELFTDPNNPWKILDEFMDYCHITQKPLVDRGVDQWT